MDPDHAAPTRRPGPPAPSPADGAPVGAAARAGRTDALLAAGLLGLSWLALFVAHDVGGADADSQLPQWVEYPLLAAMIVPLAWRRVRPLVVLATTGPLALAVFAFQVQDPWGPSIALFLSLYTAGARSRDPWRDRLRWAVAIGTMAVVFFQLLTESRVVGFDMLLLGGYLVVVNVGFLVAAWLLGDAARRRVDDQHELARRADELAAQQHELARRAVLDERMRIARELHDVVAHHVSVMGVQAAAARRRLDGDAAAVAEPLIAVEQSARDAVTELQRLVGFLRETHPDDRGAAAPQPTLEDLDALLDGSGLHVTLRRVGTPREVPAAVALSAYRIVQEALTNVRRHAGQVPATVVLTFGARHLQVEVVNPRGTPQPDAGGSGRGIVGMRERTAMLGGHLEHGPSSGGGYRVAAVLPTATAFERQAAHT